MRITTRGLGEPQPACDLATLAYAETTAALHGNLPGCRQVSLFKREMPQLGSEGAKMGRVLKRLLILGVLVGLATAATVHVTSWWRQHSVPKYLTALVSRGPVETVVNSTGTVKPVLSVSVGAFTSGPIAKVYVDFNSV